MDANYLNHTLTGIIATEDIPDLELPSPVLSQADSKQETPLELPDLILPSPFLTIYTAGPYYPGSPPISLPYPTPVSRTSLAPKDILAYPSTSNIDTQQEHFTRASIHEPHNHLSSFNPELTSSMREQIQILTTEHAALKHENAALQHKIHVLEFEQRVQEATDQVQEVTKQIVKEKAEQSIACIQVQRFQELNLEVNNDSQDSSDVEADKEDLAHRN